MKFFWCFTVFVAYPCLQITPISNFGPLPSKDPRCAPATIPCMRKMSYKLLKLLTYKNFNVRLNILLTLVVVGFKKQELLNELPDFQSLDICYDIQQKVLRKIKRKSTGNILHLLDYFLSKLKIS